MTGDAPAGDPRPALGALIDRKAEARRITDFLQGLQRSGEALLLAGERGLGRTTVLVAAGAAAQAAGIRVLAVPAEPGGTEPGAGLRLLSEQLGAPPRPGAVEDRLVASNRLLHQLRVASEAEPILVTIDDADGLDEHSLAVLAFVGRRLAGTRAGLLAVTTPAEDSRLRRRGLPELLLRPMPVEHTAAVLTSRLPDLAPEVVDRLAADASGSPLAVLELAAALTDREQRGVDPLPDGLRLTATLRELHRERMQRLSPAARRFLVT